MEPRPTTLTNVCKRDKPEPSTPMSGSGASQRDRDHPLLRPVTPDERDLAEGETELIFLGPPLDDAE